MSATCRRNRNRRKQLSRASGTLTQPSVDLLQNFPGTDMTGGRFAFGLISRAIYLSVKNVSTTLPFSPAGDCEIATELRHTA